MIRLIIIGGLLYFAWRKLKSLAQGNRDSDETAGNGPAVDGVMLKDPHCGVYFPRREAVPLHADGKTLLFCSAKCRDQYILEKKEQDAL